MTTEDTMEDSNDNTKYKDGVNKNARLIVRNISFKATENDLKEHFSKYGVVEECTLLKKPDGKLVGCGFVHFSQVPMANKALAATNKKPFLGRPISVAWAVPKYKYGEGSGSLNNNTMKKPQKTDEVATKEGAKSEKPSKQERLNRKARLIIRNISFKSTEESLKQHFEPYGEIIEVKLLKKPDGKLVGCAFVHFKNVPMAKKALLNTNMKPFLGRPISVDWAVAKDKYMQHTINQQIEIQEQVKKEESDSDYEDGPPLTISDQVKNEVKSESDDDDDTQVKSDDDSGSQNEEDSDSEDVDEDEEEDNDDEDEEEEEDNDKQSETSTHTERQRIKLNDAEDGCTVFITNIPFDIDNDQLKRFSEQTGMVKYALICIDKLTEHSKGSGFVKFVNKEDADKFLALPKEHLKVDGQVLQVKPALKRENVHKDKKKEAKDNRNLYLVKEGVIVAGTAAAVGLSSSDMAKRLVLERSKTQMLKNLNRFMSRYRLVVSNLPAHYDDAKLRQLCAGAGRKATITEARVMKDLRAPTGRDGKHPSKGYGFVMFTKHEDALGCLRKLNNNPEVFDKNNRPIVSFSIEDRTALNARKKRLEKSIANNPLAKKEGEGQTNKNNRKRKIKSAPDESYMKKTRFENKDNKTTDGGKGGRQQANEDREYVGLTSKEGSQHKIRNNHKIRAQADIHRQNVKQEKKQSKRTLRLIMAAKERIRQPKQKINKNKTGKRRRFKRDKNAL